MYFCSKCEQTFSKFRHLKKHWSDGKCQAAQETEEQQLYRPKIDCLKNVWLNDNPFFDLAAEDADTESDSDESANEYRDNPPANAEEGVVRSNSELQTELLHHIVVVLERMAEYIHPQQQQIATNLTAQQSPPQQPLSHHPSHIPASSSSDWQTVVRKSTPSKKHATPPKKHATTSFEHTNNFSVLANIESEPSPPQSRLNHRIAASETHQATSSPKQKGRPQVVINRKPEGVTTWPKTSPGNSSYADTVKRGRNVMIYSDSICNRMSKWELNNKATVAGISCQINKKPFVGATAEDLHTHHMMPTLKNNTPDGIIIHAGINDAKQLADKNGGMESEVIDILAGNVIRCGQVAKSHGVNNICISALLPIRGRKYQQTIRNINYRIENLCKQEGFDFITNSNIIFTESTPVDEGFYYRDGLHLNGAGRQVLMDNFISYLGLH